MKLPYTFPNRLLHIIVCAMHVSKAHPASKRPCNTYRNQCYGYIIASHRLQASHFGRAEPINHDQYAHLNDQKRALSPRGAAGWGNGDGTVPVRGRGTLFHIMLNRSLTAICYANHNRSLINLRTGPSKDIPETR